MRDIDYKYARENYVEHMVDRKSEELKLRGLNPTGRLFKKRLAEERARVTR